MLEDRKLDWYSVVAKQLVQSSELRILHLQGGLLITVLRQHQVRILQVPEQEAEELPGHCVISLQDAQRGKLPLVLPLHEIRQHMRGLVSHCPDCLRF